MLASECLGLLVSSQNLIAERVLSTISWHHADLAEYKSIAFLGQISMHFPLRLPLTNDLGHLFMSQILHVQNVIVQHMVRMSLCRSLLNT